MFLRQCLFLHKSFTDPDCFGLAARPRRARLLPFLRLFHFAEDGDDQQGRSTPTRIFSATQRQDYEKNRWRIPVILPTAESACSTPNAWSARAVLVSLPPPALPGRQFSAHAQAGLTGLGVGGEFAAGVTLVAEVMPEQRARSRLGVLQALSAVGNITGIRHQFPP